MDKCSLVLVFDHFSYVGSSRIGMLEAIADEGYDVLCMNLRNFTNLEEGWKQVQRWIGAKNSKLAGILSYNGNGLCESLLHDTQKMGIPISTWFIDSPYSRSSLDGVNKGSVFIASGDFTHPLLDYPKWLPFGGYPPIGLRHEPTKGLGFLGYIHHVRMAIFKSATGIVDAATGRTLIGKELYEAVRQTAFFLADWKYPTGEVVDKRELYNYLSTIKRVQHLSQFIGLDLEICGPNSWQIELWSTAPSLLPYFRPALVQGRTQMERYLTQYAVGLNIFHLQNEHGGPNFRSFECASLRVPMLSECNQGAEAIFPQGVAAMYYKDIDEARSYAKTLLQSPSMQAELSARAAEIVLQGHTFRHRARAILDSFGEADGRPGEPGEIRLGEFGGEDMIASRLPGTEELQGQLPENLLDTQFYKNMLFWSRALRSDGRRDLETPKSPSRLWRRLQRLGIRKRSG